MHCPSCGTTDAMAAVARERQTSFRGVALVLPAIALTECTACGELWLDDVEADRYSVAVDNAYAAAVRQRAPSVD